MPKKANKQYYNRTNSCDICGKDLITGQKPRREIDKEGNWTGRWLCKKCYDKEQQNNSDSHNNIMESLAGVLTYKSYRMIDGKPRCVIVDENGKIMDKNPNKDELRSIREEKYKFRTRINNIKYTNDELLNFLKFFYQENDRVPVQRDFIGNPEYPSYATYSERFGSWNNALKLVGLDIDTMVKQGILETENQKGRWFEILVRDMFKNKSTDLSGYNCNSPYDGICPNGKTYEAKSSRLDREYGRWCFTIRNKYKEDIQIFYFGAFNEGYTKLLHVWRVPGEIIESNKFCVGMHDGKGKFNVNNMKEYEITDKFNTLMTIDKYECLQKGDIDMKRIFKSVRPKIDVTNQCHRCKNFYNDKDVAILEEGVVCLNCLDTNSPEDINKMLKAGFQQEDIETIRHIQYR